MGEQLTIVMVSMHTSPLAQPGQGDAGGMNVYVRNLSDALIAAGHQVLSFTRKTLAGDTTVVVDETTGSQVVYLPAGDPDLPKEALREVTTPFADALVASVRQHARHRVILHSHYWLSGLVALEASPRLEAPVVHTMHTLGATKNSSAPGTEPNHRVEHEAFLATRADVLTANTVVEKAEIVHYSGAPEDRVQVVHPGVDHEVFQPEGSTTWPGREPEAGPKILFAGRLQSYKGPHVIVDALAVLRERGFDWLPVVHFTGAVSGSGDYDVSARAHTLGVAQYCSFSPPVTPPALASYMRASEVVVMPSVSESFGLVAVEAQACGTPVIAHNSGGLATAVADGVSGQLIDSLDAAHWADVLATVVEQPQRWKAYGEAATRHAAQFSWSVMAERMVDVYATVATTSATKCF
ncbi:MAG: glycosyltransferase [Micrococcaceae bacterium]|nr:glycosyltransferase [Micrococcaceae bacterium]